MKNSLSRKFFAICFSCVLVCVLVFGAVFLVFSTSFFKKDKYNMMLRNADIAANITANSYTNGGEEGVDEKAIFATFGILSKTIGADFLLVANDGRIIYHTGEEAAKDFIMPSYIMDQAVKGIYSSTQKIDGMTTTVSYIVGVPVIVEGKTVSTVFVSASADEMMVFVGESAKIYLTSSAIVLFISFIWIYSATSRMVSPMRQMVDATQSFASGDFSKRIPVYRQDEVGQLATAFNKMASTLATTENSRRSFVANVSHELKTPMTTIGGFVDGILDGTIPRTQQDQYLMIVSSEVKRLTRLVHSMLDTARIDAGEMKLNATYFDISELVRQSIFTFEHSVEEKSLKIIGLEQDKEMVFADRDLIHQVVYNLIENAVKFTNVGGSISVSYKKKNDMLYTTIKNTGDGISKEESEQIFDRFYKSDKSRSGHRSGVGLGLHIVKSIIKYHNGEISAHSVLGEYTEFTFAVAATEKAMKSRKQIKK